MEQRLAGAKLPEVYRFCGVTPRRSNAPEVQRLAGVTSRRGDTPHVQRSRGAVSLRVRLPGAPGTAFSGRRMTSFRPGRRDEPDRRGLLHGSRGLWPPADALPEAAMRQGCVAGGGIFRCNVPDVNAAGSHGTGWHCMRVFRAGVRVSAMRVSAVRAVPGWRLRAGACRASVRGSIHPAGQRVKPVTPADAAACFFSQTTRSVRS